MPIVEWPAEPNGTYASVHDLLLTQDRAELDIKITRWTRDGQPLRLRVRALDLPTIGQIERACTLREAGKLPELDEYKQAWMVLRHAVVAPALDDAAAQALARKNPVVIRELVDFIWRDLSAIDPAVLEAAIARHAAEFASE
ncbi:MAG TPA: hypothetical protein VFS21_29870 [Roseiflexaceae bacterium]|nr:hypothetical protein [Roseiflexaceae bacterium]